MSYEGEDLDEADEAFLHGECHLLTVALHRLSGLPLHAYLDTDMEVEGPVLAHAFVVDEEGHAVDIRGRTPLDHALDGFDTMEPWLAEITVEELMGLAEADDADTVLQGDRYRSAEEAAGRVLDNLVAATPSPATAR